MTVVTREILLQSAVRLQIAAAVEDDWVEKRLAGRRVKVPKRKPIWLPKPAGEWADSAIDDLERRHPGAAPVLMPRALTDPFRVYELESARHERRLSLLSSWMLGATEPFLTAFDVFLQMEHRQLKDAQLRLQIVPLSSESEVLAFLQELGMKLAYDYRDMQDPALMNPTRALWVGGSTDAAGRQDWFEVVRAASRALGLEPSGPIGNPSGHLAQARKRIAEHKGIVVVWAPWCGKQQRALEAVASSRLIVLNDPVLGGALAELRTELAKRSAPEPVEIAAPHVPSPGSWREVHARLHELTDEAFVLTDRARSHCLNGNGYLDHLRMWRFLQALSRLAKAWRARDGELGMRFEDWARHEFDVEVALHDAGLAASVGSFEYEAVVYSREPHVKVDDYKRPNECGRIYFALDAVNKRLIVDHVGLHL